MQGLKHHLPAACMDYHAAHHVCLHRLSEATMPLCLPPACRLVAEWHHCCGIVATYSGSTGKVIRAHIHYSRLSYQIHIFKKGVPKTLNIDLFLKKSMSGRGLWSPQRRESESTASLQLNQENCQREIAQWQGCAPGVFAVLLDAELEKLQKRLRFARC